MSNYDYATDSEVEEAREAYDPSDPKHPDFAGSMIDYVDDLRKREKEERG